jgi:hypothetical protein
MVETVVGLALKSRLRQCSDIDVQVDADSWTLLQGRVRSARVKGKCWASPKMLTARMLQVRIITQISTPPVNSRPPLPP